MTELLHTEPQTEQAICQANYSPPPVADEWPEECGAMDLSPLSVFTTTAQANTIAGSYNLPRDVFGANSTLAATQPYVRQEAPSAPFSSTEVFHLSALAMGVFYSLLIFSFRHHVPSLLKFAVGSRLYSDKLLQEANHTFNLFINLLWGLGMVAVSLVLLRCFEVLGFAWIDGVQEWVLLLAVPLMAVTMVVVSLFRWGVTKSVGAITLTQPFTDRLRYARKLVVGCTAVVLTPAALFFILNDGASSQALMYLCMSIVATGILLLVYKSGELFLGQKVSILVWILYLCAVEILPVSLIARIIAGNG